MLFVGIGLAVAFGRDRRSGITLEEVLLDLVRFYNRARFQQKGTDGAQIPAPKMRLAVPSEIPQEQETDIRDPVTEKDHGFFKVKPLPLGARLLLSILSLAFLAGLLAWLWLGGVVEIQAWTVGPGF